MNAMNIEQALEQLKQAQNDPQALTLATARIACAPLHPELFDILQVAAIPHWFDADILAHLLQTDTGQANDWLQLLIQLPMVESYNTRSAWNVHETTRQAVRTSLATNELDRFHRLSALCADYFSGTEDFQQIERIYHLLSGMTPGADQQLLALYLSWRNNGRYDAQQTLGLALAELLGSKLLGGINLARSLVTHGEIRGTRMSISMTENQASQALSLFMQAKDQIGENDARAWLGDSLKTEGKLKQALHEFQTGLRIMMHLTEHNPDKSDWLRDLSVMHGKVGSVLQAQGDLAGALQEYQADMDIMRRLTKHDPNKSDWQRDLSVSHNLIGSILEAQGNLVDALKAHQTGMDIIRKLSEHDPDNSGWLRDLSVSHSKIGQVMQSQDNLVGALKVYQDAMDILHSLSEQDPDNSDWLLDLSVAYNNIGGVLQAQKNLVGALQAYRDAMDILHCLNERDPDNSDWLRELSFCHFRVASILEAHDQLTEALIEREADVAIAEHLSVLDATNQLWQQDLQASREALAALKQRIAESGN